jgi:hypothetical protein
MEGRLYGNHEAFQVFAQGDTGDIFSFADGSLTIST